MELYIFEISHWCLSAPNVADWVSVDAHASSWTTLGRKPLLKVYESDPTGYRAYCAVHISKWNTSEVTDMSGVFQDRKEFNGNLSAWDTSKVTSMSNMFSYAHKFDGNLSAWDTSKVTSMSYMFFNAREFNGDLSAWDTSKVTSMNGMFYDAREFNGDLSAWDTSKVISMTRMFYHAFKLAFVGMGYLESH